MTPWAVVVGVVLIALNLRAPIVAPAPVLSLIRDDLGLSATAAGLLTSLPVLCFAITTPLAARVVRRAGPELAVVACLLGVLVGTVIRSAGPTATVFLGTVVIGTAIMIGNIVVPVIIRRDVPWQRASTVTAIYTATMNVGSMITSLSMAPLAAAVGWRWALASWGAVAVLGSLYWGNRARHRPDAPATAPEPAAGVSVGRIGWLLMFSFGGQSFAYYAATAWLPTILSDTRGLDPSASGAIASVFQIAAVIGAFGVPVLASRSPLWVSVVVMGVCWVALPIGLFVAPEYYGLWAFIGGIAQGGAFTAILSIIAQVTRSDREAAGMSAKVQFGGYIAAGFGAPLAGWLNSVTGGWTVPLAVILVATLVYSTAGVTAARLARSERASRGTQ